MKKGGEDIEMFDESQNKNGSQAQKFSDEIVTSLTQLMTKFVSAYKQIDQNKQSKLAHKIGSPQVSLSVHITSKLV